MVKYLLFPFFLFFNGEVTGQYTLTDTIIWMNNAGARTRLLSFDSLLVTDLIMATDINGCEELVDFLSQVNGSQGRYERFANGFSDDIRTHAFKLAMIEGICVKEALNLYATKAKYSPGNPMDDLIHRAHYPYIAELFHNTEQYLPALSRLLLNSDYHFKERNSDDLYLRKNIALLLDKIIRLIPHKQLTSLHPQRASYLKTMRLTEDEIKNTTHPFTLFPPKQ